MSERVVFEVKATPNHFLAYDYHVAQKGFCRNSIEAKKLAASINAREEELERLRAENAAQAAKIGRLRELLSLVMPDEMGGTPDLFGPKGGWEKFEADVQAALADKEPTQ